MDTRQESGPRPSECDVSCRVAELLAGYLLTSGRVAWPGSDGLTLEEVVEAAYLAALVAGHVPNLTELTLRHPELAKGITACLGRYGSTFPL